MTWDHKNPAFFHSSANPDYDPVNLKNYDPDPDTDFSQSRYRSGSRDLLNSNFNDPNS